MATVTGNYALLSFLDSFGGFVLSFELFIKSFFWVSPDCTVTVFHDSIPAAYFSVLRYIEGAQFFFIGFISYQI